MAIDAVLPLISILGGVGILAVLEASRRHLVCIRLENDLRRNGSISAGDAGERR